MRNTLIILLSVLAIATSSCSNCRKLVGNDRLFKGSKVEIIDDVAPKKEEKVLRKDLAGLVRPRPNTKTMGMRMRLRAYMIAGETKKKKGIRAWLRNKVGEPPVLTGHVSLPRNLELMENHLANRGFFNAKISGTMVPSGKKKAYARFIVKTGRQYTINEVYFRKDSSEVWADIDSNFNQTLLKTGEPYNLDVIKAERVRIDRMLKEIGYYYFRPEYIMVVADSSIGNNKVNMYVRLKHREIPDEAYKKYHINDIYIFADYRLRGEGADSSTSGAVTVDDYSVIDHRKTFKPEIFDRAMIFEHGDLYSMDDQNTSLSRLVNMGTFKFVQNRFENKGDSLLDVYYYLTPYPKKSLRFEVGANTQNDNRAGSKGSISWKHRNTFRGAEEFLFKINGGFEAQYSGPVRQPTIYSFGAETSLAFPRFVVPFIDIVTPSRYLPRSVIKLKYNYEASARLLNITSYNASYGYDWKEGPHKQHQFYPFNLTYVRTDTLQGAENFNFIFSNLVFNGLIIGPTYEFTYNSSMGRSLKHTLFFSGRVDLSGNILGIAQKADYPTNPQTLFGATYAQYVKLQPDFRHYYRISNSASFASRVMLGIGIPYGNSHAMPNIKQFWAGGNSDLRGFPSRLVGPGTFNEYDSSKGRRFIQNLGDLKFECNFELRKTIYKFLGAGIFAEAGNIWLYRNDPQFPGGTFSSQFYRELAADVGAGLRFDFKILLLRFDLGMPVRKPWLPDGDRWVIDEVRLEDPAWKKKNLIFNIAIGYPF